MTKLSMLVLPPGPQILLIVTSHSQTVILSAAYFSDLHAYKAIDLLREHDVGRVVHTHSFSSFVTHFVHILLHLDLTIRDFDS